jgi:protein-L-isoaspartate(D-aspartate) O-methyltransferase
MTETTMTLENSSATARRAMIDSQLRTSGVNEEFVLARMLALPREDFLPRDKASLAYIDRSIGLGDAGHLAAPLFYGKLLIEAAPAPHDRVLVIEGGTTYLTELLRPLVADIAAISAAEAAAGAITNAAPFTLIVIDGALEELPENLAEKLAEDGRVVTGWLLRQVTRLASGRKIDGRLALRAVEDLGIPVLNAFDKPKGWAFS